MNSREPRPARSTSLRHIPALDGLRGFAILLVFIFHYGGGSSSPNPVLHFIGLVRVGLWIGVPLFFVLSGYLITGILWVSYSNQHWWKNFYIRRSLRIFPLYYLSLAIIGVTAFGFGDVHRYFQHIWPFALYLQNLPFAFTMSDLGSPARGDIYWSLAVEEHFYLVWPFLLFTARTLRQARLYCVAIFVLSFAFRIYGTSPAHEILFIPGNTLSRVGELAIGAYLALLAQDSQTTWDRATHYAPTIAILSFVTYVALGCYTGTLAPVSRGMIVFGMPCVGILFGTVLMLCMRQGTWMERCAETRWLRKLGKISYGVYIYHALAMPLAVAASMLVLPQSAHNAFLGARFIFGALFSVGFALISFKFFESPFLILKDRFTQRRYPVPPLHSVLD